MRYSIDLRRRVIAYVAAGGSKTEAAKKYDVSRGSVHNWTRDGDGLSYEKPGPKGTRKIDRDALAAHVEAHNDATQKELACHFGVSRHCIWYNLQQLRISRKKNDPLCGAG